METQEEYFICSNINSLISIKNNLYIQTLKPKNNTYTIKTGNKTPKKNNTHHKTSLNINKNNTRTHIQILTN